MYHVLNKFCDRLDVDAADTFYSDVIDTRAAKVGDVEPLILEVWSEETGAGSGTLDITLQSSTTEAFSTAIDELVIPRKDATGLAKGLVFSGSIPANVKRYLRLKLVTTTGFTSGKAMITAAVRARF